MIEKKTEVIKLIGYLCHQLYLENQTASFIKTIKLGDYCHIKTGKINVTESCLDGKFPFFTCGKENLKINNYAFDQRAIIIAGNGDINVKYYKGKFNAYQRTYILEPSEFFFLFLQVCKENIELLKNNSKGSVIKFITKDMLEKITVDLNNNSHNLNKYLEICYQSVSSIILELEKLDRIKKKLLDKYF